MPDDLPITAEASRALAETRPGEANLLSFVVPEDVGLSFLSAGWTGEERTQQLVAIARGEAEGVKPSDQLNAIAYLDKIGKDALNAGGLMHEKTYRQTVVDGDTKYEADLRVIGMTQGVPEYAQQETNKASDEDHGVNVESRIKDNGGEGPATLAEAARSYDFGSSKVPPPGAIPREENTERAPEGRAASGERTPEGDGKERAEVEEGPRPAHDGGVLDLADSGPEQEGPEDHEVDQREA